MALSKKKCLSDRAQTLHSAGTFLSQTLIWVLNLRPEGRRFWVLSIMPKIPEISVGIQIERLVSVSSDWNIRDHL